MSARIAQVVGLLIIAAGLFITSYNGRVDQVRASRSACVRGARDLAAEVNQDRIAQADNLVIAHTTGVPGAVRTNKYTTVYLQEQIINLLDSHIDVRAWSLLNDPRDQRNVFHGQDVVTGRGAYHQPPFSCVKAFPDAAIVKMF